MIIINTKNGAVMVNENDITFLEHLKDVECAVIHTHGAPTRIHDVEQIRYTNTQNESVRDSGSLVEGLAESLEHCAAVNRAYRARNTDIERMLEKVIHRMDYIAGKVDNAAKEQLHSTSAKAYQVLNAEWEKRENFQTIPNEVIPYIDRLNGRIEELEQLVEDTKMFEEAYKSANDRIMRRSLWQQIINKKVDLMASKRVN